MFKGGLVLVGAALVAWYFMDPKRGAERRERASNKAKDIYDNVGGEFDRMSREMSDMGRNISSRVSEIVERVGEQVSSFSTSENGTK